MKDLKKLVLGAAIIAGGFSTFALTSTNEVTEIICISITEDFTEIKLEELPKDVMLTVAKDYELATVTKAYVNKNDQYKLELMESDEVATVYISKDGKWLEETDIIE